MDGQTESHTHAHIHTHGKAVTFCNFANGPEKRCIPQKLSVNRKYINRSELKLNAQGSLRVTNTEMAIIILNDFRPFWHFKHTHINYDRHLVQKVNCFNSPITGNVKRYTVTLRTRIMRLSIVCKQFLVI